MVVGAASEAPLEKLSTRMRSCPNLPSPPAVAARLLEAAADDDVSVSAVIDILRLDPALNAKLLRLANSPLYARRRHIDTLQQAVMLLGLDAVITAALSLTLLSDTASGSAEVLRAQWVRSVYAAVAAQALATHTNTVAGPDAFLAGLLQDVGVLALTRLEPTLYTAMPTLDHASLVDRERAAFGLDHAAVGAELLAMWHLPDHIVNATCASHTDLDDADDLDRVVALSGPLADAVNGHVDLIDLAKQADRYGISPDTLRLALDSFNSSLPSLAALLNAPTPPADRLSEMAAEVIMSRIINAQAATEELRDQVHDATDTASRLTEAQRHDPLTGVLTRQAFEAALDEHVDHWNRYQWPLAVMFVDIDHFKDVNDTYGHTTGDIVLTHVAHTLSDQLRSGDIIGRYGGDEFVIALPAVDPTTATAVATRLVTTVRNQPIQLPTGTTHHQTISLGVTTTHPTHHTLTRQQLLDAADQGLYAAKHAGRDRWAQSGLAD